jgi:L-2-hydroxyglutarate oxidase LhgO
MYYPTGSLKARLCVEGNRHLYEFCRTHRVPHRRTGKIITATTEEELPALHELLARGRANGVVLQMLDADDVRSLEPQVRSVGALFSPATGIVSAHGFMDALLQRVRQSGALFQPRSELVGVEPATGGWRLTVRGDGGTETFTAEWVVNAAGLEADRVAALAGIDVDAAGYRQHFWKGSYFAVRPGKSEIVSRLVYPVPGHLSLGVHAVVGLDGRLRFGPDAEYLPDRSVDYRVDEKKRTAFAASVRRLVPDIYDDDLSPDMAGIRAKLQAPGQPVRDFVVAHEAARGKPGLVNLIGIDSPGLTSALAIAEDVARFLEK